MCKKIVLFFLFQLLCLLTSNTVARDFYFPHNTYGVSDLKKVIATRYADYALQYHHLAFVEDAEILTVHVNIGSGRVDIESYSYICNPERCSLFLMLATGDQVLRPQISNDKSEFRLKTESGKVFFRMQLPVKNRTPNN